MDNQTILEAYVRAELLSGKNQTIDDDSSLIDSGILDSLALLQLIAFMEDKFNITVEDHEVIPENFQTINSLNSFLDQKMNSASV